MFATGLKNRSPQEIAGTYHLTYILYCSIDLLISRKSPLSFSRYPIIYQERYVFKTSCFDKSLTGLKNFLKIILGGRN